MDDEIREFKSSNVDLCWFVRSSLAVRFGSSFAEMNGDNRPPHLGHGKDDLEETRLRERPQEVIAFFGHDLGPDMCLLFLLILSIRYSFGNERKTWILDLLNAAMNRCSC